MPSTIQLARTITVTQQYIRNAPLTFGGGNNEPAFTNADWVRQFLLTAPFAWPWNRKNASFNCTVGIQDYVVSLSDYGWLEKAVNLDPTSGNQTTEMAIETVLGKETVANQPTRIAPLLTDTEGNVTFRIMPPPDKPYTVELVYQMAAPSFANTTDTWAPIPDKLSFLFNQGFLAKAYEYLDDPRFGPTMTLFLRQVLAANEALTDADKNIFLIDRTENDRQVQNATGNAQLARQARAMF